MNKYDKVIQNFGKRVKKLRVESGHSQEAFAQEAEIDRSYYGRIERGEANLTLRNIAAIADLLGLSIPELFIESGKPSRTKTVKNKASINQLKKALVAEKNKDD